MGYNQIIGCITSVNDDSISIDDSKFLLNPLPIIGEEFDETELKTLVCSTELK